MALVLTRKDGEGVWIGNTLVSVTMTAGGRRVRLVIDGPREIPVIRKELVGNEFGQRPESVAGCCRKLENRRD